MRAAYRKDPDDAEAILSAARERIRVFKNGFLDGEYVDDGERDEDSESDVAEDPDIDDTEITPEKEAPGSQKVKLQNAVSLSDNGKESVPVIETPKKDFQNIGEGLSAIHSISCVKMKDVDSSVAQSVDVVGIYNNSSNFDDEDPDIDESNPGELWVQGLMEGEYSDLSVEERLNALVALIGVAVEGNSIRLVLEVCLLSFSSTLARYSLIIS